MSTLTLNPTVNGDVYGTRAAWPVGDSAPAVGGTRYAFGVGYNGSVYYLYNGLFRFDTSSLDDTAVISSAKLRLYWRSKSVGGAATAIAGEYFDPGATIGTSDFASTLSETAFTKVLMSGITVSQYYEFTLLNPNTLISKTGFTGIRTHSYYDTTPVANHLAEVDLVADTNKPELVITYTVPVPGVLSGMTGMSGMSGMTA